MTTSTQNSSKIVVYAALAGNFAIAIVKFIAAWITGSSAMLSEGVHSLVDSTNEILLLYGVARSEKRPDEKHPFGYGRELYFWAFIVALLVFAFGAGVSIYEGIVHIQNPVEMERPLVNYVVLAICIVFEAISWGVALKEFKKQKGTLGYFQAFRQSKDPTTFTVLFEDSAALIGLFIALLGVTASHLLEMPALDGAASVLIGIVLAISAIFLARETKDLLLGESAAKRVHDDIATISQNDPDIDTVNGVITEQIGPHQVLALLSAKFSDNLTTAEIETCINRIESSIRSKHPEIFMLFVKPQTNEVWQKRLKARLGKD